MSNLPPDLNPYASPAEADGLVRQPVVSSYELLKDVKRFRTEIHALGAWWMVIGGLPLGLAVAIVVDVSFTPAPAGALIPAVVLAVMGVPFLIAGIFTCLKQIWAVYVGLALSYLFAVVSLLSWSICFSLGYAAGIFGGHRILSWAREFQRKGIPLTTRPKDIHVPLQRPTFLP